MRGRSAAVLATFAIGSLAAVGAFNLGLLSSDPASGEFGLLAAPTQTEAPTTNDESPVPSETTLPTTSLTTVATAVRETTTTAEPAATPAVTTTVRVAPTHKPSPPSIAPAPTSTSEDHADETSVPRRRRTPVTQPRQEKQHNDDDD